MRAVLAALVAMAAPAYADHVVVAPPAPPPPPPPAQQPVYVATDPVPTPQPDYIRVVDRPSYDVVENDASAGVTFTGGWAAQHGGLRGWVGRIDGEVLAIAPPPGESGGVFGVTVGGEYWQANPAPALRDFGVALPMAIFGGARGGLLRIVVGGGFDAFLIDHVGVETGFGVLAPFALAQASIDDGGWRLGVDARVERHWLMGAEDHTRYQVAVTLGYSWRERSFPVQRAYAAR